MSESECHRNEQKETTSRKKHPNEKQVTCIYYTIISEIKFKNLYSVSCESHIHIYIFSSKFITKRALLKLFSCDCPLDYVPHCEECSHSICGKDGYAQSLNFTFELLKMKTASKDPRVQCLLLSFNWVQAHSMKELSKCFCFDQNDTRNTIWFSFVFTSPIAKLVFFFWILGFGLLS